MKFRLHAGGIIRSVFYTSQRRAIPTSIYRLQTQLSYQIARVWDLKCVVALSVQPTQKYKKKNKIRGVIIGSR
jgi:hypothetical protein